MHAAPSYEFAPTVPQILIASVVVVSLLGWLIKPLQRALMLIPYRVRESFQVYRLLTAGWVHKDVMHLIFNMISLYLFAEPALKVLGVVTFLALYVSAVVMAFVPTTLRFMTTPNYASLGASGAVTAVMFSAILLNPTMTIALMFLPIPIPGLIFALLYLVYSVWQSYRQGDGINHDAHLYGGLYGVIFTYAFEPKLVEKALKSLF
ncbi:MAG: rhomboid family intramembrane serine protease [Byssovorax sp.]